ncbi:DUF4393 domain-containing protein [Paenarthrobacter ureafaciens]|uniref:DUF4393 domain-containing protein n=1 Tax=Paenarthrobacter ureafaciens TaxID=37931 RepID=UPI003CEDB0FF
MTGGEIAAAALAGKVVSHAGKELADESKSIRKELLEQATQTREFDEAARNYAKRVAIRQELLTVMYKPIAKMLGFANKYFDNDFEADMAKKLADVPEENITPPSPSLAASAMLQLGFSLDEPGLKDMYLELLATASDSREKNAAHPSFVEIIKQLSANELPFLENVLARPSSNFPVVRLKVKTEGSPGAAYIASHLVEVTPATSSAVEDNMAATYVDNWARLGLITIDYKSWLTDPDAYTWAESSSTFKEATKYFEAKHSDKTVVIERGILQRTDFGEAFADVVGIFDKQHVSTT